MAWSYVKGLERLADNGGNLSKVRSVASIFVSRLDSAVDKWLDDNQKTSLRGVAAVSNCAIVYHKFKTTFAGSAFKAMQAKGAHVQRVLWASTGTKDPQYSDVKYLNEFIAEDTVNTVPDKTLDAYLDHGAVKIAIAHEVAHAQKNIEDLRVLGIDVNVVCLKLLEDGLTAFEKSFEELTASIEEKAKRLCVKG